MRLSLFTSVSVLVLASLAPLTAQAGFEFVAPEEQAAVAAAPAPSDTMDMPAIPADVVDELPLSAPSPIASGPAPIVQPIAKPTAQNNSANDSVGEIVDAPMRIAPAPAPLTPVVQDSEALVMEDLPVPVIATKPTPAPHALTPVKQLTSDVPAPVAYARPPVTNETPRFDDAGAVVQGFGNDVPLVLALQQIVPANYRYSFDGDVQPGMRIDWSGGKPWKSIIVDLARDNGMNVDIVSNVVAFRRKTAADPVMNDMSSIDTSDSTMPILPIASAPAPIMASAQIEADPIAMPVDLIGDAPASSIKDADAKSIPLADDASYASAPIETTPIAAAPIIAEPAKKVTSHSNTADLIWDNPQTAAKTTRASSYGAETLPAPSAYKELPVISSEALPEPEFAMKSNAKPVNLLPPMTTGRVDELAPVEAMPSAPARQELASISDTPQEELAKKLSAAQTEAATPAKKAVTFDSSFDSASDAAPAKKTVKEKVIMTADNDVISSSTTQEPPMPLGVVNTAPIPVISAPNAIEPAASAPASASVSGLSDITPSVDTVVATNSLADAQQWEARKSDTLRQALTAWCERIGVSLVWSSEYDYPLQTDVRIDANFPDAVRTLLAGFAKAQPRPMGRLFKNQQVGAQPVLVVETQRLTD